MPNRNRRNGDAFERRVRDTLEDRGWWVIRAAGSLGSADLVGLKKGQRAVLVACKINGKIGPRERGQLWGTALMTGAVPLIVSREKPGYVLVARLTEMGVVEAVETWHMPAARPRRAGPPYEG